MVTQRSLTAVMGEQALHQREVLIFRFVLSCHGDCKDAAADVVYVAMRGLVREINGHP